MFKDNPQSDLLFFTLLLRPFLINNFNIMSNCLRAVMILKFGLFFTFLNVTSNNVYSHVFLDFQENIKTVLSNYAYSSVVRGSTFETCRQFKHWFLRIVHILWRWHDD